MFSGKYKTMDITLYVDPKCCVKLHPQRKAGSSDGRTLLRSYLYDNTFFLWEAMGLCNLILKQVPPEFDWGYISRVNAILRINDKIIVFDGLDHFEMIFSERLSETVKPDLLIKLLMSAVPGYYSEVPFPVTPFAVLSSLNYNHLRGKIYDHWSHFHYDITLEELRDRRDKTTKNRSFSHSILCTVRKLYKPTRRQVIDIRKSCSLLKHSLISNRERGFPQYLDLLTKVGAVMSGQHCSNSPRGSDVDAFAIGTPVIRAPWTNLCFHPIIENVHYVCVPKVQQRNNLLSEIDKKFPNHDQFVQITKNARQWYDDNASPEGSFRVFSAILKKHGIIS